jgi:two-component system sensor histidine kinase RegB
VAVPTAPRAPAPASGERALGVNFAWLIRLRFGAVLGQALVIAAVTLALDMQLPFPALALVLSLELVLNAWAIALMRSGRRIRERHVALAAAADVLLFSALLYFTGGPSNPFSFLYLIHIALAAVVLPERTSFALVGLALSCSLALFFSHTPLPHDHAHHQQEYVWHLRGMWVAFGLAACFIVYFIKRILRELSSIERQLAESRERAARHEGVAALAMLSAGAAHELASPLSTISVAAGELLRRLPGDSAVQAAREDVTLIRAQVERCRAILEQLSAEAGQAQGSSFDHLTPHQIAARALAGLPATRLELTDSTRPTAKIAGPLGALAQAVRNLVMNALDASPPAGNVHLQISQDEHEVCFAVHDRGPGMSEAVLARATEPFFTTKPRGQGMGLGLFLVQSVAEQIRGRLELSSAPGEGTTARLYLPLCAERRTATNGRMVAAPRPSHAAARAVDG